MNIKIFILAIVPILATVLHAQQAQPVINVAAGFFNSLFLKNDGSLWAMGRNDVGELGDGTYNDTNKPEEIVTSGVTAIAAGGNHSLFLKSDGSLWAMGDNDVGELGDGTYNNTNQPEEIVANGITAIAAGTRHSLFVKNDGSLWAMGYNGFGQLGDGTYNYIYRPEQIVASGVTAIAAGYGHSLFLKSDGSLWAMGDNFDGQLGDGTYNTTNRPEEIVTSGVTAIAAGWFHSLFLKSDGSLWAMGYNNSGQLGDGTYNNTNQPEQIVVSGVTAIAANFSQSLFLKSDGSLWAMGANGAGQLGDGTYNTTNQPEEIVTGGVTAIAEGRRHSLFLKSNGSLWAMGNNGFGQLGDGTYNGTNQPEQIVSGPPRIPGISMPCYLMSATPLPPRQSGMNNLVVVTHGFQSAALGINDITWITNMCLDISNQLECLGSNDWQVEPYSWVPQAGLGNIAADAVQAISSATLAEFAEPALDNGEKIGTQIGRQIAEQGWSRVHLIGHSAGAGLIQAAAVTIRANCPTTIIQTTFLDPFLGADYHGLSWYGSGADWSDNYFTYDLLTGPYTQGTLPNSYNVDVTWTDPQRTPIPCASSTAESTPPLANDYCYALSSHGWPCNFYIETVLGTEENCAVGYGFPLSIESGGWNNIANDYEGQTPVAPCGSSGFTQNQNPMRLDFVLDFNSIPYGTSGSGVNVFGNSASLTSISSQANMKPNRIHPLDETSTNSTGTTAWLAVDLTITNTVNFVQFDARFTDTNGADGLLTVYWDTNQIGTVDERVASAGLQTYRFFLPVKAVNSIYILGFRLDSFDNTSSSITITNISTGFVGITTSLTLGLTLTNNTPFLQLTGASNYNYLVESSTNLLDWTPTALLVNSNGTVSFHDSTATNSSARFYRAAMP